MSCALAALSPHCANPAPHRTARSYVDAGWSRERAQREWRKSEPPQGWRPYYEAHMRTEQGAADDTCPDAAGLDAVYNIMSARTLHAHAAGGWRGRVSRAVRTSARDAARAA